MGEKFAKLKEENKILVMLAFYSISLGIWKNFQQLWLQDNNMDISAISKILSVSGLFCAIALLIFSNKITLNKIKKVISSAIFLRTINLLILFLINHSGMTAIIDILIITDTILEKLIVITIYPFIVTVKKDDKLYSKRKLVEYLWKAAGDYRIQIVFTTHSPIILKCVNKYYRKERQEKGINLPLYAYDSAIVYLEPCYSEEGKRTIMPKNISSSEELSRILNDINLTTPVAGNKINVYCEDARAISFLQYILNNTLSVNLDLFMAFIDINLGWPNYIQLAEKRIPEFRNNIIVLDGDVPNKPEYRAKARIVNESGNFLFLPLVIEKDMFKLLKDHAAFLRFQTSCSRIPGFNYDICFNNWPLEAEQYNTTDFKHWFEQTVAALGDEDILFTFWYNEHLNVVEEFVEQFVALFNTLAEKMEVDGLPSADSIIREDVNTI